MTVAEWILAVVVVVLLAGISLGVHRTGRAVSLLTLALYDLLGDDSHLDKLVRATRDVEEAARDRVRALR